MTPLDQEAAGWSHGASGFRSSPVSPRLWSTCSSCSPYRCADPAIGAVYAAAGALGMIALMLTYRMSRSPAHGGERQPDPAGVGRSRGKLSQRLGEACSTAAHRGWVSPPSTSPAAAVTACRGRVADLARTFAQARGESAE